MKKTNNPFDDLDDHKYLGKTDKEVVEMFVQYHLDQGISTEDVEYCVSKMIQNSLNRLLKFERYEDAADTKKLLGLVPSVVKEKMSGG